MPADFEDADLYGCVFFGDGLVTSGGGEVVSVIEGHDAFCGVCVALWWWEFVGEGFGCGFVLGVVLEDVGEGGDEFFGGEVEA